MSRPAALALCWFGKVRSRGDFVRSTHQGVLTQLLDQWLSQGLERLAEDARWKQLYDRMPSAHFAVLGTRGRLALAGHLMPSMDASGRRFPFVTLASLDTGGPAFVAQAPLALSRPWQRLGTIASRACAAEDVAKVLDDAARTPVEFEDPLDTWATARHDFLATQTLGSLQGLLRRSHPAFDLRRALLALGLLLQPVPASGVSRLDKGLRLPLPEPGPLADAVGALWLELITPFLARGNFELVLLVPRAQPPAAASLVVGFAGPSPTLLQALFDPGRSADAFIELQAPQWIDAHPEMDGAMRKLNVYLHQDALSLQLAVASFKACFHGA
ncbi:type VI secretion system-associated protein TagF [Azohydromonas caseinilytica]|uniref:Type VI secretion system-associated protein TagF n=1 Tax=Azohydromonas caseinilytica TaxID=2728836 RepID=A0A848FH48_9BURK|nr:type VI secretion system-associated protein TagF [Azohydromonas caseinilytica]NML18798.1 type VI secretion system-associated protein TagF [Azohydromonas caseinilytica]